MTYSELKQQVYNVYRRLAQEAWQAYVNDPRQPRYLAGIREHDGCWQSIQVVSENDPRLLEYDGLYTISPEPFQRDAEVWQLTAWVAHVLAREPLAFLRDLQS